MTTRHGVAPCGKNFNLDGWDHVPAAVTMRVVCPDCSAEGEANPSGLHVTHMIDFLHPEGKAEVVGELGPQP